MSIKNPVIGFDMDGVILDNSDYKVKIAKDLGFDLKRHHTPYVILKTLLPQIVLEEIQKLLYNTPHVALSTPLMRGAKSVLAALQERNITFHLISRRKIPEIAIDTLKKHSIWPQYFHEGNSFFVNEPEDKNKQAVKLGVTHFIDDELVNINALSEVPNRFLFDKFNVFEDAGHYIKIKSWVEFKKHFPIK